MPSFSRELEEHKRWYYQRIKGEEAPSKESHFLDPNFEFRFDRDPDSITLLKAHAYLIVSQHQEGLDSTVKEFFKIALSQEKVPSQTYKEVKRHFLNNMPPTIL